jgi:hypothetical protein
MGSGSFYRKIISPNAFLTVKSAGRTPFDQKLIGPKHYSTEHRLTESSLPKQKSAKVHLTESTFDKKCHKTDFFWKVSHLTERLFGKGKFDRKEGHLIKKSLDRKLFFF